MELNYKKNKNKELFEQMEDINLLNLENIQNYIPIYDRFFQLTENNYNSINLNNSYKLDSIEKKLGYSKFSGKIIDSCNNILEKKIFFKYSPLIDPIKYMIGKYEASYNIYDLPKKNQDLKNEKFLDPNNSAYIDGFFSFLSSILLNKHNFINGIDYYGSFLGIKNDFMVQIDDDIEYLNDSDFFHKNNNQLFKIIEGERYKNIFNNTKKYKQSINIYEENIDIDIDLVLGETNNINQILDNLTSENISDLQIEYDNNEKDDNQKRISDISNNKKKKKVKTNELSDSGSSCSSRYSNTISSNDESSDNESSSSEEISSTEEELHATINKFPVQTIALECCDDTLDSYIVNNKIKDKEWESIILQILFTLLTYQKLFNFTHNDLHTNNIVFIQTDKVFIYYKYDNKHYKVPTFGKIYKIIDFGRAIYTFKNELICSDSYSQNGDANTQYNCEPYFNANKARLEPNYSFDLCRLGCSLFDYFIDDIDDIKKLKSPIKKLMVAWVFDDKNKNILYKNDGNERYPDFKLYKMIARTVHNHTPQKVIKNEVFETYVIAKKKINRLGAIINIDNLPIMI